MFRNLVLIILCSCCLVPGGLSRGLRAAEGSWPQFRGPDRTDVSWEKGILKKWPPGGPPRVWLYRDTGVGYSGPAIAGGRLFIMGARDGSEQLMALDAASGKPLWSIELGEEFENRWGNGPRGTPTVDGPWVYALSARGNLVSASVTDGRVRWKRTMQQLGGSIPNWGYCESVLVDGDRLVCTPGGEQGALAALNKQTGEVLWHSQDFTDGAQYASIIAADHNGVRQYIQLTKQTLVGIHAENGDVLWRSGWSGQTAVIPTPIFHDSSVYITSGYGVGCKRIALGPRFSLQEIYANKVMKNHHGGVVLIDDHLYGYSDGLGWLCQDFASGEQVWREKQALGKGALTCVDGMLYCLDESDGSVVLAEASPAGWREHGRFVLEPQTQLRKPAGRIWTHPVVVGGRLYLRDQELLFCFDVAAR
ncbi:MAG: PQQ-binding-like beta-propeller repeat protein [Planctomycetales bacterium]|nr:PQQ-binding-like beta-propeller repeat protein [Planctomycetales bacterium]NIM07678.1 PQQ-binding-like beta-propeller repeat protein [Planctomycetales bacterium]NIN07181.1 PQQ-binding-like beta-propeller repeat protein [Planctomycetales bacterium]NIN76274.1 PQQ-binding-like beta-propeller repeat protein [Planctomycetales bacterium]NIO33480.1 PQQ-binding-like beta-propeller repeat protein [Planctomycetales bacterium]